MTGQAVSLHIGVNVWRVKGGSFNVRLEDGWQSIATSDYR
jgi:hypothetical protein